jgi:peroxiredoxin (alkyl hydroperoxide reductase subunit C)
MNNLIQKQAPNFIADAVMENGKFKKLSLSDYINKYIVLFFYPLNFTFVCPTEIISFSNRINEFKKRNTQILGISVDSKFSHQTWKKISTQNGGIGNVNFPLISDLTKDISKEYGVLIEDSIALRGTFLIDKKSTIRHSSINDLPIGRNIDEIIRIIDALQFSENNNKVCPAQWNSGDQPIEENLNSVSDYLSKNAHKL